jgi:hypothetical protein
MFLLKYLESRGFGDAVSLGRLSLISALTLYLTDFLNRVFSGENAKNREFSGGEKMRAATVYHAGIKHGAGRWIMSHDVV